MLKNDDDLYGNYNDERFEIVKCNDVSYLNLYGNYNQSSLM